MNNGNQRHAAAIEAILQCGSLREAAEVSALSARTLRRYMSDPSFKDKLQEARDELVAGAINKLRLKCRGAVDVLDLIAHDPIAPHSARVSAARALVSLTLEAAEMQDLRSRLESLEKQRTIDATPTWSGNQ
jgi:hypothetical protein